MAKVPEQGGKWRRYVRRPDSYCSRTHGPYHYEPRRSDSRTETEVTVEFTDVLAARFAPQVAKALSAVVLGDDSLETAAAANHIAAKTLKRELDRLREMYR